MKVGVHVNEGGLFDSKWIFFLNKYGCEVESMDFKSEKSFERLISCDGAMWHYRHNPFDKQVAPKILDTIENVCKIPVWPNWSTRWHFDEKISQSYILKALGEASVKSWIFYNKEEALEFISSAKYPLVFKLSVGAGSANITRIDSKEMAQKYVDRVFDYGIFPYSMNEYESSESLTKRVKKAVKEVVFPDRIQLPSYFQIQKGYAYFQQFIPDNAYDIRVTIIGKRAFGFIRHNRENDFRASGSGSIEYDSSKIPEEAIKTGFRISEKMKFQSMAYDFLIDDGKCIVNEMSYGYVDKAVYDCTGHWDIDMQWHEGNMWPEEAHVVDYIEEIKNYKRAI